IEMGAWRASHPNPGKPKMETHRAEGDWTEDEKSLSEARQLCYKPINLSSPKMMLEAFHILGIPAKSTSKDALDDLPEGEWPVVDVLKAYRKANMFPVKFGAGLLQNIHPATDRIHPAYIQIGADTGRMSCTNPPWQQIPAKGDGAR